jgi:hypothetical protein
MHMAAVYGVIIILYGVVHEAAVIPENDIVGTPFVAANEMRIYRVLVQEFKKRPD